MRKRRFTAMGAWEESADGLLRSLAAQADYRIAADGGWRLARRAGLTVERVIGDGDSLSLEERTELLKLGIWQRHPADKDQTDFELALAEALAQQADKITCAALLGKRADQALGNLFTLEGPARAGARIEVVTPEERLYLVQDELQLAQARLGDIVSLLALSDRVTGVETQGLRWPLRGEELSRTATRGLPNQVISLPVVIQLFEGLLWVIHRPEI